MKKVAITIPCLNEAQTIGKVIQDFRKELPNADIYVLDNNSTDDTARIALENGAQVLEVKRPGKGSVIRSIFREIEADIYVTVDGDDTYPAEAIHDLLQPVLSGEADMSVGDRHSRGGYRTENKRMFHNFGNGLVTFLINFLMKANLVDIMSGYRAMSRRFVKNCPVLIDGFEVETEITLHALDKLFRIREVPIEYRDRPDGSFSKLNTFRDGFRVLRSIVWVFKDCKPFIFFLFLSVVIFLFALLSAVPPLIDLFSGNIVSAQSLIFSATVFLTGLILLACGFILDTIVKLQRERYEVNLLQYREDESSQS